MRLRKLGHCCLTIEEKELKILTDPGGWTTEQDAETGVDVVLITHEHPDHFHIESLKKILANNPRMKIFTNKGVGKFLDKEGVQYELLEGGQNLTIDGVLLEAYGEHHADIYSGIPVVANTGYVVASRFFYPGDALTDPGKPVEILALPVAGPWIKISESIDYAKKINPKACFPVHDGMLKIHGPFHKLPEIVLSKQGIEFFVPELGKVIDL